VEPITIKVCFRDDPAEQARREKLASRVRDYFEQNFQIPDKRRVLCYFSDHDALMSHFGGPENRGVHGLLTEDRTGLPEDVRSAIAAVEAHPR
jgi:hypothetical protein